MNNGVVQFKVNMYGMQFFQLHFIFVLLYLNKWKNKKQIEKYENFFKRLLTVVVVCDQKERSQASYLGTDR